MRKRNIFNGLKRRAKGFARVAASLQYSNDRLEVRLRTAEARVRQLESELELLLKEKERR